MADPVDFLPGFEFGGNQVFTDGTRRDRLLTRGRNSRGSFPGLPANFFSGARTGGTRGSTNSAVGLPQDPIEALEQFGNRELTTNRQESGAFPSILDDIDVTRAESDTAANRAVEQADRAANVQREIFDRRTKNTLTARQKAAADVSFSLNRAVTKAGAATGARANLADISRGAASAAQGLSDTALGQQLAGLSGLANAEGQRKINEERRKAQQTANRNSFIGTVVGAGIRLLGLSSEYAKDQVEEAPSLLNKLDNVRIDKWKYHGGDRDHIGPYAEEFNKTFGVGKDHESYLDIIDVLGVTLGTIKELKHKVDQLG